MDWLLLVCLGVVNGRTLNRTPRPKESIDVAVHASHAMRVKSLIENKKMLNQNASTEVERKSDVKTVLVVILQMRPILVKDHDLVPDHVLAKLKVMHLSQIRDHHQWMLLNLNRNRHKTGIQSLKEPCKNHLSIPKDVPCRQVKEQTLDQGKYLSSNLAGIAKPNSVHEAFSNHHEQSHSQKILTHNVKELPLSNKPAKMVFRQVPDGPRSVVSSSIPRPSNVPTNDLKNETTM